MRPIWILLGVLVAGCGHSGTRGRTVSDAPEIFWEDLRSAYDRPADAMRVARAPLLLDNASTIKDCSDYLAAQRAGAAVAESTEARLAASEYVVCDALDALRCRTRGASGKRSKIGEDLAHRLDLRQIPSSLGPRLDDRVHTLDALGEELKTTDTTAGIVSSDWTFILRIVAVADVDANGTSDWIVSLTDEAHVGSYRDYSVLVVFDPDRPAPLHVEKWPPKGPGPVCPGKG